MQRIEKMRADFVFYLCFVIAASIGLGCSATSEADVRGQKEIVKLIEPPENAKTGKEIEKHSLKQLDPSITFGFPIEGNTYSCRTRIEIKTPGSKGTPDRNVLFTYTIKPMSVKNGKVLEFQIDNYQAFNNGKQIKFKNEDGEFVEYTKHHFKRFSANPIMWKTEITSGSKKIPFSTTERRATVGSETSINPMAYLHIGVLWSENRRPAKDAKVGDIWWGGQPIFTNQLNLAFLKDLSSKPMKYTIRSIEKNRINVSQSISESSRQYPFKWNFDGNWIYNPEDGVNTLMDFKGKFTVKGKTWAEISFSHSESLIIP